MPHPFEVRDEIEVEATPEQVWEAIATGAGLDAWFMGSNEIEPHEGGAARLTIAGMTSESRITTWDPNHRLVIEAGPEDDGRLMAFEYVIEGRDGGRTLVRLVHSGFLADASWEAEYDGLKQGDPAYFFKLGEYLRYFRGRRAVPVMAFDGQAGRERTMSTIRSALGLGERVSVGDPVHATLDGLPPIDGEVDYLSPDFVGVRTGDAMYRFVHGFDGTIVVGHHLFTDVDQGEAERAWQSWLGATFA